MPYGRQKRAKGVFYCKVSVRKTEIFNNVNLDNMDLFLRLNYIWWDPACAQGIDSSLPLVQIAWLDREISRWRSLILDSAGIR